MSDNIGLQKKAKERTVKTQNIEYDLETLVKKIQKGYIKLDPDYQRRHRWTNDVSSRLVESLMLNIPIPIIYLSQDIDVDEETENARYSVIDGQQRLTAIYKYLKGEYPLEGLGVLTEIEGLSYDKLPQFLIRRLEERTIKCLRIDSTADEQLKFDIFERLNTGSIKLESQELRNATCRGPFNELIKRLAKNSNFRSLLQIDAEDPNSSKKFQKMEDIEMVLRFFALYYTEASTLAKGFKQFLDNEMIALNKKSAEELLDMESKFKAMIAHAKSELGNEAFAKYKIKGKTLERTSKFNAAVFDAFSVAIAKALDKKKKLPKGASNKLISLFKGKEFFDSVTGSVNDKTKVLYRLNAAKKALNA